MLKGLVFVVILACLSGCTSDSKVYRIAFDSTWGSDGFGQMQPYINGYVQEFLLELSMQEHVEFEHLEVESEELLQGLKAGEYDGVLTTLLPYNFHRSEYDFSENFLPTGPVLVVPVGAKISSLSQLQHEVVGAVFEDPGYSLLQTYEDLLIRQFESIPSLLEALAQGEIEGALVQRLPAIAYVNDLYASQLKVVGEPLTEMGLRLVVLKNKQNHFIDRFNRRIEGFKSKKELQTLQKKWQLLPS